MINGHFLSFIFIFLGGNFESVLNESTYKTDMTLRIKSIGPNDFGNFRCIAKNSLGETDSTIKLYSKCLQIQKTKNKQQLIVKYRQSNRGIVMLDVLCRIRSHLHLLVLYATKDKCFLSKSDIFG